MNDPYLALFNSISSRFCEANKGVHLGKMMSSPGLKFNNKVFAFYHKETMGFRLGTTFDPISFGLKNVKPLSPFKTKPPLKGWYVIEKEESVIWDNLAGLALDFTMTL